MPNVLKTGSFVGAGDGIHNAEGLAKIIPLQDESSILRLENLESQWSGSVRIPFS